MTQLVELKDVIDEAFKDKDFMEALLGDVDSALTSKGWELSSADDQLLKDLVKGPVEVDSETVFRSFNEMVQQDGIPWVPPPWNPK